MGAGAMGGAGDEGPNPQGGGDGEEDPIEIDSDDDVDDPDANVFASPLVSDLRELSSSLNSEKDALERAEFEAKHHPAFLAYKLFGLRSNHPMNWFKSQPLSVLTPGGVSNRSRAAQKAEHTKRHEDKSGGGPESGKEATAAETLDRMELATRMHMSKTLAHKLAKEKAKELWDLLGDADSKEAYKQALQAHVPTVEDCLAMLAPPASASAASSSAAAP